MWLIFKCPWGERVVFGVSLFDIKKSDTCSWSAAFTVLPIGMFHMSRWGKETTNFCASNTESVGIDDMLRRPAFVRVIHSSTVFLKGNQHRLSWEAHAHWILCNLVLF